MKNSNSRLQRLKLDAGTILGFKDGIFRRDGECLVSHFYGIAATLLMFFLLAITPEVDRVRSRRWRKIHTVLNCIALLFFGQRVTGSRDLLEIILILKTHAAVFVGCVATLKS